MALYDSYENNIQTKAIDLLSRLKDKVAIYALSYPFADDAKNGGKERQAGIVDVFTMSTKSTNFGLDLNESLDIKYFLKASELLNSLKKNADSEALSIILIYLPSFPDILKNCVYLKTQQVILDYIPLIAITCMASKEQRLSLLDHGKVDLILEVPFNQVLFLAQLNSLLRRNKKSRQS